MEQVISVIYDVKDFIRNVKDFIQIVGGDEETAIWKYSLEKADQLYYLDIDPLPHLQKLLRYEDRKVVLLSMLYIGILHKIGRKATYLIPDIQYAANYEDTGLALASGFALIELEYPPALQVMKAHMKQMMERDERRYKNGMLMSALMEVA